MFILTRLSSRGFSYVRFSVAHSGDMEISFCLGDKDAEVKSGQVVKSRSVTEPDQG